MDIRLWRLSATAAFLTLFCHVASAQFKTEAFSQSYNDDNTPADSASLFSFKDYFGGLSHKNDLKIGTLFAGSTVFVGGEQIYNKQYWKLPIIYGGLGASVGLGFVYRNRYNKSIDAYNAAYELNPKTDLTPDTKAKTLMTSMFIAGGAIYWSTLMDGVVNYNKGEILPGRATLYSALLPGLGQIYNGEYWKIPIYWGGMIGSLHFYCDNKRNFERYKMIYQEASDKDSGYNGSISSSTAEYYKNLYRRYRDYSLLAVAAFYLVQVIDANVFAYMQDFEVNDDLSMHISPTILTSGSEYAFNSSGNCLGMSLGIRF